MAYANLLCSSCTIQSLSTTIDAMGQVVEDYSAGTRFNCRLDPYTRSAESEQADRRAAAPQWRLFLDDGTGITESHRVVSEGLNYNVLLVQNFFGHHTECDVERVL